MVWGNMWGDSRVCRLLERIHAEGGAEEHGPAGAGKDGAGQCGKA